MTDLHDIPATLRDRAGKGAARAVRRQGLVPCVVYGGGKSPAMIAVDPRVIWKGLRSGHFYSVVYQINIEGGGKESALARDVQFHPVTDAPLHVDFVRVRKGSSLTVTVPVRFLNEGACPGLKAGGTLNIVRHELELVCPADAVPPEVECDLAVANIGDTIRISDIAMPKGVESAITDRDPVVANIAAPRVGDSGDADGGDTAGEEDTAED